ncbi:MAG: hypothetical protein ACLTSW_02785 [Coprococcus sp.]|jgi:hypothetical protein
MTSIISAMIAAFVTLIVCLINNHYQQKAASKKHDETIALIEYRLDELTKHVEKHNNVIERTYQLEKQQSVTDEKLRVANRRIEDLENLEKKG